MKHTQLSLLSLALISAFSAAYADDEPIAGRIPFSLDNHAQQAAEQVRKINAQQFSGSLNGQEIATPALQDRNDGAFSGSLNMPIDLQVKGYQPEINQSYDLQSNSNYVLPVSNTANAVNWQIDDSYALETGNYLNNVFQQDTDTLLLAENTITDTATDANSGSLKESSANSKEIATPATQSENDDNHQDSSSAIQNDSNTENTQNQDNQEDNVVPVAVTASTGGATQLDDITVKATRNIKPAQRYEKTMSRRKIEMSNQGNGDIGSMLRGMSNVQFDNSYNSSATAGEIDPAKISISGGQFYQNKITIDGINIASKMDPANESGSWLSAPPGHTQTVDIDVDLLDKVTVLDSAIPAEHGGFSGGVVETELRRPEVPFGFKISRSFTNGHYGKGFPKSLTKYHIYGDEDDIQSFLNSWDKSQQPNFKKYKTQITAESIINDHWGVIGSFNLTESKIPLNMHNITYTKTGGYVSPVDPQNAESDVKNQKRQNLNALIKAYYDPNEDLGFELSYLYAPNYSREYFVGTKDADYYDNEHGGHQLTFKTKWNNPWGKLTNTFGFQNSHDEVKPANDNGYIRYWAISDSKRWSNWASWAREGSYAGTENLVNTFSNTIEQEFKPFKWGKTEHTISAGADLSYSKASFAYTTDFWASIKGQEPMTKEQQERCLKTDQFWCDPAPVYDPREFSKFNGDSVQKMDWINFITGQKTSINYWPYGQFLGDTYLYDSSQKIKTKDKQIGLFLQDEINIPLGEDKKYGEFLVRPGMRYDYNSYMKKHTFAPRFFTDYAFPWSGEDSKFSTHISGGYSRYYGSNFYSYAINDGKELLEKLLYRDDPGVTWDEVLAEGRICEPYEREKINGEWVYWHYRNGQRVEGIDNHNCIKTYKKATKFDELKVPYSDEFMVGISQDLGPVTSTLKFIRRNGRDEVVKAYSDEYGPDGQKRGALDGYSDSYYTYYTNAGKSKSNIVTLDIKNTKPLVWKGIRSNFTAAFDWTQTERNKASYNEYFRNADYDSPYILYNGELIHRSQRPADNFTKPYTIKLEANHEWDMLGGKWSLNNLFKFQSAYKKAVTTTKWDKKGADFGLAQDKVSVYEIYRIPSYFTWDMKLGAEYAVYKKNKLFFNIDVSNVLNKKNTLTTSVNTNTGDVKPTYGTGRAFWFELGYKYH